MNWRYRLGVLFNIRPGEGRPLGLLFGQYFFLGLSYIFTTTVAFALFLQDFGQQNLAFAYLGMGVMVAAVTLAYLWLSARLPLARLLVLNLTMLLLGTLGFYLGIVWWQARWLIFVLPGWYMTLADLGNIANWNLSGCLFDVRQGKRLFGLISAARWLAFSVGGALVPLLVVLVGTTNLLLAAVGSQAVAIGFQLYTVRAYRYKLQEQHSPPTKELNKPATTPLRKSRLAMLILGFFFLMSVAYTFTDLIFNNRATAQFPATEDLASFLGIFSAGFGFVTLLSNLFVVSRVLGRFGLRVGLLTAAVSTTLLLLALAVTGSFGSPLMILFIIATIAQLVFKTGYQSLQSASLQVGFHGLPPSQRIAAQAAAEGIGEPLGYILSGLLMLVLNTALGLGVVELSYIFVLVGVAWIWCGRQIIREYPVALRRLLTRHKFDEIAFDPNDEASLAVLRQGLESEYPGAVIYSLNLLEQFDYSGLDRLLPSLLSHPSPEVRHEILKTIERRNVTSALPAVNQQLALETVTALREVTLRTLAALGADEVFEQVMGYLDDREPNVRRGAMIGLLQHGGIEGVLAAGQKLMNMTVSADPAERVLAAQILGEVGLRSFYQPLLPLLKDSDPVVKSAAIQAVGKIKHSKLWPPVIEALTDIRLRPVATRALIAGGESALPEIQLTFEKAGQPREVLGKLVHVCSRIKTERVINLLEDKISFPDPAIRTQILTALCAAQYRAPGPDTTLIQRQIKTEVEEAAQSFALLTALDERPEAALLVAALKVAQKSIQERLFFLLSFLYDGRALQQVQNALKQETGPHRSYALEILDTMLAPDIKNYMLALLEELTPAQRLQKLKGVFSQPPATVEEQLRAVCAGESLGQDYWVRSCAIYAAGQLAFDALAGTINSALTAPEPAVRETAQLALSRLNTIAYTAVGDSLSFSSPRNFLPEMEQKGTPQMYSTIEKVIILKTVNIFAETPDEALVEVAGILEEVEVSAGEQIFEKDELGDTMYIIVNGKVRVHNGEVELNILKERDIFGEMAVLDAEPRSASVTALEDCLLFRLNQDSFYELMADRIEITRGIVRVLSGHVRARVRDVMELRAQLHEKELAANQ